MFTTMKLIHKHCDMKITYLHLSRLYQNHCKRCCTTYIGDNAKKTKSKVIHPFLNIHPWRSQDEFSEYLVKNVIYNKDGLVALNKPYGIPAKFSDAENTVPNAANYTLFDSLQYIANALGHSSLQFAHMPEKYMSGVALLAVDEAVKNQVKKSIHRTKVEKNFTDKYYIVTTSIPKKGSDNNTVGLTFEWDRDQTNKKPTIIFKWSKSAIARGEVKPLHYNYRVITRSPAIDSSLIEMQISTRKFHALRLLCSIVLYSPVLGDNICGSRVQKILGSWTSVNPFSKVVDTLPKLNTGLLASLLLKSSRQEIIPVHVHLKELNLPYFNNTNLKFVAPMPSYFQWTCDQLLLSTTERTAVSTVDLTASTMESATEILRDDLSTEIRHS